MTRVAVRLEEIEASLAALLALMFALLGVWAARSRQRWAVVLGLGAASAGALCLSLAALTRAPIRHVLGIGAIILLLYGSLSLWASIKRTRATGGS